MIIRGNFRNPTETNDFHIRDTDITPEHHINLLLKKKLSFNEHISQVCCKASHQFIVLRRIGSFFGEATKLLISYDVVKPHIHANQYGAVKGSSTALVDMLHHWHIGAENCQTSRVLLLDYCKAFDLVHHNIIIAKFTHWTRSI